MDTTWIQEWFSKNRLRDYIDNLTDAGIEDYSPNEIIRCSKEEIQEIANAGIVCILQS